MRGFLLFEIFGIGHVLDEELVLLCWFLLGLSIKIGWK